MTNEILDNLIYRIRSLHYSMSLPIWLYCDKQLIIKMPEDVNTARFLLMKHDLIPEYTKTESCVQILQNEFKEIMIVVNLCKENCTIMVGPLLSETITDGNVTNMIRNGLIPFHNKSTMITHYEACPILDERRLFYTSKILEDIFLSNLIDKTVLDTNIVKQKNNDDYGVDNKKDVFSHSPYTIEQDIAKCISLGDAQNAKRLLREINMNPHAILAANTLRSYKNSMICSCAYMTRAAIAGGVKPDDAFTLSDSYINRIEEFSSIKELELFETTMIDGFANRVNSIKKLDYSRPIFECINYIQDHLCEDLSIEKLGNTVFLNPSYLSNLFHKETGTTISEWIQKRRIVEASNMVLNSNETIADIAFFYHFSSQSYFVQCFKKYFNVTPGEYRRNKKN